MKKQDFYIIQGKEVEKCEDDETKENVWFRFDLGFAQIKREWLQKYKEKHHPNDDWTNVDLTTYAENINWFDEYYYDNMITEAIKAGAVGYLD